jgi:ubiquinone biosynthesis protein UbiJ
LGGWVFDFLPELGAASEVAEPFTKAIGEVAAASVVEVAVKESKQISTGLARMSIMLIGKTTPDQAAMLHSEFLISPI